MPSFSPLTRFCTSSVSKRTAGLGLGRCPRIVGLIREICDEYHAAAFLIPSARERGCFSMDREQANRGCIRAPLSLRSLGLSSCARTTAVSLGTGIVNERETGAMGGKALSRVKFVVKHPDTFIFRFDQRPQAVIQWQRAMPDFFQNRLEQDHGRVEKSRLHQIHLSTHDLRSAKRSNAVEKQEERKEVYLSQEDVCVRDNKVTA